MERTPPLPHPKRTPVAVTTLSAGQIEHETFSDWRSMCRYDVRGETAGRSGCNHITEGSEIDLISGPRVAEGRTQLIEALLKDPTLRHIQWMLCIDSDMSFPMDALCQLLGHAYGGNAKARPDKPDLHIIGGLCFAGNAEHSYPTIYSTEVHKETGQIVPERVDDYPRNTLVKCGATGAAFLLIHRQVLHHMLKPWPEGFGTSPQGRNNPHPWFAEGEHQGVQYGEDIVFCQRASALGYPTYVHTGVKIDHIKKVKLNEAHWEQQQDWAEFQAWRERRAKLTLPEEAHVA